MKRKPCCPLIISCNEIPYLFLGHLPLPAFLRALPVFLQAPQNFLRALQIFVQKVCVENGGTQGDATA
ncbi:MAG: hypothetical protein IKU63_06855 [Bacteroidaceae bacterium]|nr:hypothetical protein [Bacteroidaceae bacterium]